VLVIVVWSDFESHEFGSFDKSVDAYGEILSGYVYVACIEQRQHAMRLQLLEVLIVGELHFVAKINYVLEVFFVVDSVVDSILHASVNVDGEHAF